MIPCSLHFCSIFQANAPARWGTLFNLRATLQDAANCVFTTKDMTTTQQDATQQDAMIYLHVAASQRKMDLSTEALAFNKCYPSSASCCRINCHCLVPTGKGPANCNDLGNFVQEM